MDAGMYGSSIGKLINEGDTALIGALRRAAKNDLYVDSRSIAVNGLTNGSVVVTIVPGWQKALLIANAVCAAGFVGCPVAGIVTMFTGKKEGGKSMKGKSMSEKLSLIGAGIGTVTLVIFCIYGLVYDYMDIAVAFSLVLSVACGAGYVLLMRRLWKY